MPNPELRLLRHSIFSAERKLAQLATSLGKDSPEYRSELKKLMRAWSILKMTHSREEFLQEIVSS